MLLNSGRDESAGGNTTNICAASRAYNDIRENARQHSPIPRCYVVLTCLSPGRRMDNVTLAHH